jgi:2-amino-4-hydroxy-6-hydroxymethyldihydropteridine diphosphokinase
LHLKFEQDFKELFNNVHAVMSHAYLLLGSNMGNKSGYLSEAIRLLENSGCAIIKKSLVYEAEAWGHREQDAFLNQVLLIETNHKPEYLLTTVLNLELQMGRQRFDKWHQRIIDIDILFYENQCIDLPGLNVPHPHIAERRFTLVPLAEIARDLVHPECNKTIKEMLEECSDPLNVRIYQSIL